MKRLVSLLAGMLFFAPQYLSAAPVTISDTYVGGMPTNSGWYGADIVGENQYFGIDSMSVGLTGGTLSVGIVSNYFDNVGLYNTFMGDLFISTKGWTPFGSGPGYSEDDAFNGTHWNYVLHLSDNGSAAARTGTSTNYLGTSGVAYLYAIPDYMNPAVAPYLTLSSAPSGYIYRAGQVVSYNPGNAIPALALGSWSITDLGGGSGQLNFNIGLGSLGVLGSDLGLHWGMSCANDVIEGRAAVPEPATAALFLTGLLPGVIRRMRRGVTRA